MGWFDSDSDQSAAYDQVSLNLSLCRHCNANASQVVNAPHKAELSHELLAAAASYEVGIAGLHIYIYIFIVFLSTGCQGL